jgi:3alpha(or 20beta)-hydroxysteroid dehydrogenase
MNRLAGKIALVTGAARGQGEAEGRMFAAEGAKVVLGDVLDAEGEQVAKDIGDAAVFVHHDVSDPASWERAIGVAQERFGALNVLINNAGILRVRPLELTSLDDYMAQVNVNQVGCFLGMKAVVPAMKAAGGGSIVNTSSTSGLQGAGDQIAYVASKWAIRGMTKTAAVELGRYGIRVNSVHPGGIDTEMVRLPEFQGMDQSQWFLTQPVPRIGRPEEVAALMVFLASDESSYCTGAEFVIDGGMTAAAPYQAAVEAARLGASAP